MIKDLNVVLLADTLIGTTSSLDDTIADMHGEQFTAADISEEDKFELHKLCYKCEECGYWFEQEDDDSTKDICIDCTPEPNDEDY